MGEWVCAGVIVCCIRRDTFCYFTFQISFRFKSGSFLLIFCRGRWRGGLSAFSRCLFVHLAYQRPSQSVRHASMSNLMVIIQPEWFIDFGNNQISWTKVTEWLFDYFSFCRPSFASASKSHHTSTLESPSRLFLTIFPIIQVSFLSPGHCNGGVVTNVDLFES